MSRTKEFAAKAETRAAAIKLLRWMVREYLGKHVRGYRWDWVAKPEAIKDPKGWRASCMIELTTRKL